MIDNKNIIFTVNNKIPEQYNTKTISTHITAKTTKILVKKEVYIDS